MVTLIFSILDLLEILKDSEFIYQQKNNRRNL